MRTYIHLWFFTLLSSTLAQLQTFTPPGQSEITYSVNIPQATASSGSGPIYFQLKSTRQLQWFAWGQGSYMPGSNIFVVYSSGNGQNVTVSPRLGVSYVQPLYNPQARLSVLSGSGISNGVMTANIRCDSCITWPGGHETLSSSSSPFIWAVKAGAPLNSNSLSATITIHDISGAATLDLQKATGGSSDNPFLASSGTVASSSSGQSVSTINNKAAHKRRIAHASIMIVVFVILFPFFALTLHLFPSSKTVNFHASFQLFTLALAIAGLGIGLSMAKTLHLTHAFHPIIGMSLVSSLLLFQPAMGFLQHRYFCKTGRKSAFAYIHRWFGRGIICLGVVNAGLGFYTARKHGVNPPNGVVIAYPVVVGVVALGYILVVMLLPSRKRS